MKKKGVKEVIEVKEVKERSIHTKKRDVITTSRFSKTNYLKTNLLKQIKNIFSGCKITTFPNIFQIIMSQKVSLLTYVKGEKGLFAPFPLF